MKVLYLFHENKRVGVFSRDENLVSSFSYDEQWQVGENSFPLSLAMPLSHQTFNNRITLSFFENLLPEGEVRDALERDHNIHSSFEFLELFGQDCAGAFTITADKNFSYIPNNSSMKELGIKEGAFTQRVKEIRELILTHKDLVLEEMMDKHPHAKIPKRINALISKRAKGLYQQGV